METQRRYKIDLKFKKTEETLIKYTYTDVKAEFEERGYDLVSTEYRQVSDKLDYICRKHPDAGVQTISFSKFHSNHQGCKFCGFERRAAKKRKKFDKANDKKLCESKGFIYCDTIRENSKIYITFICPKHADLGIQKMQYHNMDRELKGCQYCSGKNLPSWYIVKQIEQINPDVELLEIPTKINQHIQCKCRAHGIVWTPRAGDLILGKSCRECGREKNARKSVLSLAKFQEKVSLANSEVEVVEYSGARKNAKFKCKLCGHIWESSAESMTTHGKMCPNCCHYYKGERLIEQLLTSRKIRFESQKRFDDCKDKRPLPFDFYLPELNACVEYDGQQHFYPVWGDESYAKTVEHDGIKNRYCERRQIPLLRIPYTEQEIENKLDQFIESIAS